MSVLTLVVLLCLLGGLAWLVNAKLPIPPTFKGIITLVILIVALVLVLMAFGVWNEVKDVKVPKL